MVAFAADTLVATTAPTWTVDLEYEVSFTIPSVPAGVTSRFYRMEIISVPIDDPGHPFYVQDCYIDDVLLADDLPTTPTSAGGTGADDILFRSGPAPDLGTGTPSVVVRFPAPSTTGYETAFNINTDGPDTYPLTLTGAYAFRFWYVLSARPFPLRHRQSTLPSPSRQRQQQANRARQRLR